MAEAATLEEVEDRIRKRVGKRSPFHLMDPGEAEEALSALESPDPDHWAEAWSRPGARREEAAREAESGGWTRRRCGSSTSSSSGKSGRG